MSLVKHQHYVPQFYLKNFADAHAVIWVYDKINDRIFHTHVKKIAGENYFYDAPSLDKRTGKQQAVEKLLCAVEGKANEVLVGLLTKLTKGNFVQLETDDRNFLAIFLVVQMLRTKEHRILQQHQARLLSNFLKERCSDGKIVAVYGEEALSPMSAEQLAELQGELILDGHSIRDMAMILNQHIWMIYRAKSGQVFLTSDNPFCKQAHVRHPFRRFSGIRSRGIEIMFPISPDFCLCLAERSHFRAVEQSDGKLMSLTLNLNMVYYNYQQIKNSTRYLFSSRNDFAFVQQVCREEPILKNPRRKRITSNHDTPGDLVPEH